MYKVDSDLNKLLGIKESSLYQAEFLLNENGLKIFN